MCAVLRAGTARNGSAVVVPVLHGASRMAAPGDGGAGSFVLHCLIHDPANCWPEAFRKLHCRGAWVAQSVKRPTSARSRSRGP